MTMPDSMPARILLIEDNPADVYLICEALNENGVKYILDNISDGEDALEYFSGRSGASAQPDLIILDLNLPKIEGGEILEVIHASKAMENVPVVILTSSDSPQDKRHAAEFGARSYIRKPSNLDAFLQIGAQIKDLFRFDSSHQVTA